MAIGNSKLLYSIDIIIAYQFSIGAVCTKWFAINLLKLSLRMSAIIKTRNAKTTRRKLEKSCANKCVSSMKNGKACQSNSHSIAAATAFPAEVCILFSPRLSCH